MRMRISVAATGARIYLSEFVAIVTSAFAKSAVAINFMDVSQNDESDGIEAVMTEVVVVGRANDLADPDDSIVSNITATFAHSAEERIHDFESTPPTHSSLKSQAFYIPSLHSILDDNQKVAAASLCWLVIKHMSRRYALYEYIDHQLPPDEWDRRSGAKKLKKDTNPNDMVTTNPKIIRAAHPNQESHSLLNNEDDEDVVEEEVAPRPQSPQIPTLPSQSSVKQSSAEDIYSILDKPFESFKKEKQDSKTPDDHLFFDTKIDGNMSLYHAMETCDAWGKVIMEKLFDDLCISPQERVFIEQMMVLGLDAQEVAKSLMPSSPAATPDVSTSRQFVGGAGGGGGTKNEPQNSQDIDGVPNDIRPCFLWNLTFILFSMNHGKYDARSRVFLRRIAVDCLQFGSWLDVLEKIELPMALLPVKILTKFDMDSQSSLQPPSRHQMGGDDSNQRISGDENGERVNDGANNGNDLFSNLQPLRLDTSISSKQLEASREQSTQLFSSSISSQAMMNSKVTMLLKNNEREIREQREKKRRMVLMTMAAVGGGAIIGLSTGIAAPMLGAGIAAGLAAVKIAGTGAFFGSMASSALITGGGVLAGTGYGGYKMAKRTAGIHEFRFVPIQKDSDRLNLIICISGWITSRKEKEIGLLTEEASRQRTSSSASHPKTTLSRGRSSSDASMRQQVVATQELHEDSATTTTLNSLTFTASSASPTPKLVELPVPLKIAASKSKKQHPVSLWNPNSATTPYSTQHTDVNDKNNFVSPQLPQPTSYAPPSPPSLAFAPLTNPSSLAYSAPDMFASATSALSQDQHNFFSTPHLFPPSSATPVNILATPRSNSSTPTAPLHSSSAPPSTKSIDAESLATDAEQHHDEEENEEEMGVAEILANGLGDLVIPFMGISPVMGSHYALVFETEVLRSLGDALRIFASELISFSAQQILQQTILATLLSALNWPMWLLKLGYILDNPWSLGLDRSRKAGLILADSLCNNVHLGKPVTLVGYSLGARAIFYCLCELASRGQYGVVEDVFMFGAPVLTPKVKATASKNANSSTKYTTSYSLNDKLSASRENHAHTSPHATKALDEWRLAAAAVSGRLVNCFCRKDWILGFLFRAGAVGNYDVAGLGPVILDEFDSTKVQVVLGTSASSSKPTNTSTNSPHFASETPTPHASAEPPKTLPLESSLLEGRQGIIHNVDISDLVQGHFNYKTEMPRLARIICGFSSWSDDFDTIEEIIVGTWTEDVDGWWKDAKELERTRRRRKKKAARSRSRTPNSLQRESPASTQSGTMHIPSSENAPSA